MSLLLSLFISSHLPLLPYVSLSHLPRCISTSASHFLFFIFPCFSALLHLCFFTCNLDPSGLKRFCHTEQDTFRKSKAGIEKGMIWVTSLFDVWHWHIRPTQQTGATFAHKYSQCFAGTETNPTNRTLTPM